MPYRDPERQRRAQREFANARRQGWLAAQTCGRCGSRAALSVFGAAKGAFTSSRSVRDAKLASATVLCAACVGVERRERAAGAWQRKYDRAAVRRQLRGPRQRSRSPVVVVTALRGPRRPLVAVDSNRLPCAPLERISGLTAPVLAQRAGFDRSMGHRWRERGLNPDQADVAAIAAGLHPVLVWPDWLLSG